MCFITNPFNFSRIKKIYIFGLFLYYKNGFHLTTKADDDSLCEDDHFRLTMQTEKYDGKRQKLTETGADGKS